MSQQFTLVKAEAFNDHKRRHVDDLPTLLASTDAYIVGQTVSTRAEGYSYDVVDSAPHLTTAGGTQLRLRPKDGRYHFRALGIPMGDGTDVTAPCQMLVDFVDGLDGNGGVYLDGEITVSTLDMQNVNLVGSGYYRKFRGTFGHPGYTDQTLFGGAIIRSTATTGNALQVGKDSGYCTVGIRDVMIIGPGSGTSTGLLIKNVISSAFENVQIMNFDTGVNLDFVEDCQFNSLRIAGAGSNGIYSNTIGNNQNVWLNTELQNTPTGINWLIGGTALFLGGVCQGGMVETALYCSATKLVFSGWHIECDPTSGNTIVFDGAVDCTVSECQFNGTGHEIRFTNASTGNLLDSLTLISPFDVTIESGCNSNIIAHRDEGMTLSDAGNTNTLLGRHGDMRPWQMAFDYDRGQVRNSASRAPIQLSGFDTYATGHVMAAYDSAGTYRGGLTFSSGFNKVNISDGSGSVNHLFHVDGEHELAGPVTMTGSAGYLSLTDGITAPGASIGQARLFVDGADGALKVKFGDGTVRTVASKV